MGCACKNKIKKVEKLVPELHGLNKEKKTVNDVFDTVIKSFKGLIYRLFIVFMIVVLFPFVLAYILLKYIFLNDTTIIVPTKWLKNFMNSNE